LNKGQILGFGILIGYFAKQDEARGALRELARQGFSRTALVHKGTDGEVHISDPFFWRRARWATLAAILFGGIGGIASFLYHWSQSLPGWRNSSSPMLVLACATIGALSALLLLRRSKYGVEPGGLRDHARWLMSGESVLILQAPVESLLRPGCHAEGKERYPSGAVRHAS
jgi:cyclic beta-1,2-glucan synthetase